MMFLELLGQNNSGAYEAGQWAGRIFLIVLIAAIVWKLVKKK